MTAFVLTDDLLTGLPEIDRQHRVFFAWGNRVLGTRDLDRDLEVFGRAVLFIQRYAEYHFAAEEFAMDLFGYPGAAVHRSRHALFMDRARGLADLARAEGLSSEVRLGVYFLIQDWFPQHIGWAISCKPWRPPQAGGRRAGCRRRRDTHMTPLHRTRRGAEGACHRVSENIDRRLRGASRAPAFWAPLAACGRKGDAGTPGFLSLI
ncbi:MAG: hemerythrin family protein, partial [Deltaproteobacteria bacterium]|nr:hemerythrin family protein [Deltaproteobacteria bacterium]